MGINSITKTPCGFCFVEYYSREHTDACLKYISGTVCDSRIIRCDLDAGFKPGRQFGRGQSGGKVRDERRRSHDTDRTLPSSGGGGGGGYRTVQIVPPPHPPSTGFSRAESIASTTSESILAGLDRPLRSERSESSSKGRVFSEMDNNKTTTTAVPADSAIANEEGGNSDGKEEEEGTNAKRTKT